MVWWLTGIMAVAIPSVLIYFGKAHVTKKPLFRNDITGEVGSFLKATDGTEDGKVDVHWIPLGSMKKEIIKNVPKDGLIRLQPYEGMPNEGIVTLRANGGSAYYQEQLGEDTNKRISDMAVDLRDWKRKAKFSETKSELASREADERVQELDEKTSKRSKKNRYEDEMFPGGY